MDVVVGLFYRWKGIIRQILTDCLLTQNAAAAEFS